MLIADSDDVFLSAAMKIFSADFEVCVCQDGDDALKLIASFEPQVMIINLLLPHKDGITVLQQTAKLPPVILAITSLLTPHIERACKDLAIGFLMVSPHVGALRVRVIHMVNQWEQQENVPDLRSQAVLHLHILNFPSHRIGYRQLCDALPMYYRDREQCLDTVLYAELARMFHKSGGSVVERSIRKVIEDAWSKRDKLVWSKYFPFQKSCPSNKVFLDAIANHMTE